MASANQPRSARLAVFVGVLAEFCRVVAGLRAHLFLIVVIYTVWLMSLQFQELFYSFAERTRENPYAITTLYNQMMATTCFFGSVLTFLTWLRDKDRERRLPYYATAWILLTSFMFWWFFGSTIAGSREFGWPNQSAFAWKTLGWTNVAISGFAAAWFVLWIWICFRARWLTDLIDQVYSKEPRLSIVSWISAAALIVFLSILFYPEIKQLVDLSRQWLPFGIAHDEPVVKAANDVWLVVAAAFLWLVLFALISLLGVPGLEIFIVAAIVVSLFDRSDNHEIRQQRTASSLPTLQDSFSAWLKARSDRAAFAGTPYPVYIVAAEGGGLYAAIHAATLLDRLNEVRPNFAEHVFAASGVSGGAFGVALFSSAVRWRERACAPGACEPGPVRDGNRSMLASVFAHDFLTPLVLRTVTSDLGQRALPFAVPHFDRARGLEFAIEEAWALATRVDMVEETAFARSFSEHWRADKAAPALVLNATEVETGQRMALAPFSLKSAIAGAGIKNLRLLQDDLPGFDLPLSTAVVLSARFPYVTPAGYYVLPGGEKRRLVDGGYYDNTGIETALDLICMLERIAAGPEFARDHGVSEIRFVLLSIHAEETPATGSSHVMGEVMSPIRTMIASWRSRREVTFSNAKLRLNERFRRFTINPLKDKLPLSWYLSAKTRERINRLIASRACLAGPDAAGSNRRHELDCAAFVSVANELQGNK